MTVKSLRGVVGLSLLFACAAAVRGADWPQFQGPFRDGTSPETGLARSWPEAGPRELWSVELGEGYAGPAVANGRVYILDREDNARDVIRCLSLETGEELWRYAYDAEGKLSYNGSRTTPTVVGDRLYCVGPFGHMHCIDLETHEPVWSMDILEAFAAGRPHWGVAQSPLYHEGRVYVAPQGETTVVALDADTGGIIWKSARMSGGSCYVSPVLAEVGGVLQVVMLTAKAGDENPGQVAGFRADTGETLWQYDGYQCDIPIPYPKPLDDGRFFITGEYGAGSAMIRVTRQGEAFSVEELYKTQDCGSQIHQPLLVGDHLYANSNGNRRRDGLVCMALDGTRKWRTRDMDGRPIFEKGGLLLADGMIFIMEGDDGTLHLVEPSTEGYRELASARVFSGKLIWAPMALSDGRLVLRDQKQMKCLDVRAQAAP